MCSVHFNSIQFYLYSAITTQLSQGALQSPEPGPYDRMVMMLPVGMLSSEVEH